MLGLNQTLTINRPTRGADGKRDGGSAVAFTTLKVHLQPLNIGPETIDPVGQEKTAVMTLAQLTPLQVDDNFSWHGRTWWVKSITWIDGRGAHQRCVCSTVRQ